MNVIKQISNYNMSSSTIVAYYVSNGEIQHHVIFLGTLPGIFYNGIFYVLSPWYIYKLRNFPAYGQGINPIGNDSVIRALNSSTLNAVKSSGLALGFPEIRT